MVALIHRKVLQKYLAEKAVDKETPVFKWAMEAFASIPLDDLCYDTNGKIIDEFKVTGHGHNLIRCACIARAGDTTMLLTYRRRFNYRWIVFGVFLR